MSDVFEGPGWWMASDGKWYPPHLHADASYRARWVNVDAVAPSPETSEAVLTTEPVRTEPATTISQPADAASWVPEPRAARPVADVPPTTAPQFVPSDKVAERAAALADTARAESIAESATETSAELAATPAPAPAPVATTPSPAPVATTPAPVAPPQPVEDRVAPEAAPMPEPVVAPHEAPTPLHSNGTGPDGYVAFGAPSSTPVSEILNRLGEGHAGSNGAVANGTAPVAPPTPSVAVPLEPPAPEPNLGNAEAADEPLPEMPNADADAHAGVEAAQAIEPSVDAATPPPAPEVRIGPAEEPDLDPIEFERAVPPTPDPAVPSSRARLEVGAPTERGQERFGLLTPNRPTEQRITLQEQPQVSSSTDLVPVSLPEIAVYHDGPSLHDRLVASVLFLSGVALIVGTFLVWTTAPGEELTGWDMNDGIVTIIAGVLGSAAAGPIFVGFRHVIPKTVAILSGLVALVVPGLKGLEALSDSALAETGVGAGFWTVLGGAIAMLLAGVADQSRFGD